MSDDDLFGPEHVRVHQETDGRAWRGARCLPLIYREDDGRHVIVAPRGVILERV